MDKSSFQKLFKELYGMNPKTWNTVLEKSKTKFSETPKPSKQNRQAMSQDAFKSLLKQDYKTFQDFGKKADATINRPKSVRINGETLQQNKNRNQKNKDATISAVDSSAVERFRETENNDGPRDVTVKFTTGDKEYLYPDVPSNVAQAFYVAPSKGSFVIRVLSDYSDYSNPKVQEKIRN